MQLSYCDDEDNTCVDGSECGGKEINIPGASDIETIGNYKFPNFPEETGMIDEKAATTLNNASSYMNVILGDLNKSLEGNTEAQAYFADYINNLKSIDYKRDNTFGIDKVINKLNEYHKTIFVEIVKNINTPLDQNRLTRYYKTLDVKIYEEGWGDNLDANTDIKEKCEQQRTRIINEWIGLHNVTGTEQPFDIENDMNCGYTLILQDMDRLLDEAATNIGHGVTAKHLSIIKSGSNIIKYLDAKHDFYGQALHNSCVSLESQGTIDEAMDEASPLNQNNMMMNERSL